MVINEEKTQVTLPHTATEMTLAIDCDDELELIPGNMPIKIESLGGTRPETIGKNLFRIQKEHGDLRCRPRTEAQIPPERTASQL